MPACKCGRKQADSSLESDEGNGMLMMMRGMSVKNFDPVRYAGRWFEVASLKCGFAGQGQEDSHCTRGVYIFDTDTPAIQVDTFCIHGGPAGYITGALRCDSNCYDNYALFYGAKNRSFIQKYSRAPTPGPEFIEKYKSYLANFGYDRSKIKDIPQDREVMSNSQLAAMMSMSGMQQALTNQLPDLELKSSVKFNPFTSVFDTLKKLVELYFKQCLKM